MEIAVIIPALEPDERLCGVVRGCRELGLTRIVVVDDGSAPEYRPHFDGAAALGALVVRHERNLGKGSAIRTGLRAALGAFPGLTGAVTADADGQHAPRDILRLARAVETGPDALTLGVRDFDGPDVPARSRFGNRLTAWVFRLTTGVRCRDTQTGLRGFGMALFDLALTTPGERYEYEMEFLTAAAERGVPLQMLPIETIYLEGNASSHFHVLRDSARIYRRPLLYLAVSLSSAALDLLFFALFSRFFGRTAAGIWGATVLARLLSAFCNFRMNQCWSFHVKRRTAAQLGRYAALSAGVMLLSAAAVSLLRRLPLPLTLMKCFVDLILFFLNYQLQRRWVFAT